MIFGRWMAVFIAAVFPLCVLSEDKAVVEPAGNSTPDAPYSGPWLFGLGISFNPEHGIAVRIPFEGTGKPFRVFLVDLKTKTARMLKELPGSLAGPLFGNAKCKVLLTPDGENLLLDNESFVGLENLPNGRHTFIDQKISDLVGLKGEALKQNGIYLVPLDDEKDIVSLTPKGGDFETWALDPIKLQAWTTFCENSKIGVCAFDFAGKRKASLGSRAWVNPFKDHPNAVATVRNLDMRGREGGCRESLLVPLIDGSVVTLGFYGGYKLLHYKDAKPPAMLESPPTNVDPLTSLCGTADGKGLVLSTSLRKSIGNNVLGPSGLFELFVMEDVATGKWRKVPAEIPGVSGICPSTDGKSVWTIKGNFVSKIDLTSGKVENVYEQFFPKLPLDSNKNKR